MEFTAPKNNRGRKKRRHQKKRRCEQIKFEVKSANRQRYVLERTDIVKLNAKEEIISNRMQANSFWQNYTVAQEWQKRHNVTWWRTRCFALEHENKILRNKLRSLASQNAQQRSSYAERNYDYKNQNVEEVEDGTGSTEENENLEFHVNEDMMSFLEQSIRHKIELKKKREAESSVKKEEEEDENACIQGGAAWMNAKNNNAKLLYGNASSTILAMETALQTTIDRHKDIAKPQYWPVIPLKL